MNDPKDIFKKFSLNSRKILISAQKIALNSHVAINSQHLLLALAVTPGTLANSVLNEHLISLDQIRLVISLQTIKIPVEKNGLSAEIKKILEDSAQIAANFHDAQIDPEHLLMAITGNPQSFGYQIISRIGSEPESIHKQIKELFFN